MTTEQTELLKTSLKYGLYGLLIASGLLVGGYIMPDTWLAALKVLWGGLM